MIMELGCLRQNYSAIKLSGGRDTPTLYQHPGVHISPCLCSLEWQDTIYMYVGNSKSSEGICSVYE